MRLRAGPLRWANTVVGALVCAMTAAGPSHAQDALGHRLPRGAISGVVIDAGTAEPLAGATVVLEARAATAFPIRRPGASAFIAAGRGEVTGADGAYRFDGLTAGRYRLRVERLGYRPATVDVELSRSADSRVSIGLTLEPIALQALEVEPDRPQPYGRTRTIADEIETGRLAAVRLRQRTHLATDVRALTHADVIEGVTLGETDLFRALRRFPGVSTRDDYSAALWTRGASWDQTRVYFDGLPLYNPVHAFGIFSGVSPDAVGAAFFHPGVRPASLGGGAAGVVDLRSRAGGGESDLRGGAALSLASARLALDQRIMDGRAAWMLAGRRSYLDWATGLVSAMVDQPEIEVPYAFSDVTGRFDLQIDDERRLEVSGIWERDRISGDVPDILHGNSASWGNLAARATYAARFARGLASRHTIGISRYGSTIRRHEPDSALEAIYNAPGEPATTIALLYAFVGGTVDAPARPGGLEGWSAGYRLVRQSASYLGPRPIALFGTVGSDTLSLASTHHYIALWGERRWTPADRLTVGAGLRLEVGEPVRNGGAVRIAPRLTARFEPNQDLLVSAGIGRHFQYAQAVAPAGPFAHRAFPAAGLWLLAGPGVPAVQADLATLGAEYRLGGGWLAAANAFVRRAGGMAVPDPTPGPILDRPLFVLGENAAHGLELSIRRLVGRWSASLAYTYGVSELEAAGLRFPAPADRRHVLDATTMVRIGSSLRLGAAYTAATGAPFTRLLPGGAFECDAEGVCVDGDVPVVEAPGAERLPAYASLDLLLDWTLDFGSWDLGAYLQVRNALFHENAGPYSGTALWCDVWIGGTGDSFQCVDYSHRPMDPDERLRDTFEQGLPILPLLGLRVGF